MPRARDPNRDKAFEIWKQHKGDITNRALAGQLGVPEKTISAWKSRDKWNAVLQKDDCSTTNKKHPQKVRLPNGSQHKRSGNHNPKNQFAKRNKAAEKHGFFSKYIPEATLEIMGILEDKEPSDLIWDQIQIQYAAIVRSQQIMFVENKEEMIKELKKTKESFSKNGSSSEEEWEFQFSWDRQATFLNAQSRAMGELRSLIKQFEELAHEGDARRLKLEGMRLGIEKTKAEVNKLTNDNSDKPIEIVIKRKGDK